VDKLTSRAEKAEGRVKVLIKILRATREFFAKVDSLPRGYTRVGEVTEMIDKVLAREGKV
jgi:hypothetical protein